MSRIFISYSRRDQRCAVALKQWIAEKDPALRDEIFVDVDPDTGSCPGSLARSTQTRQQPLRGSHLSAVQELGVIDGVPH